LTEVCHDWEHYAYKLTQKEIRVVTLRFGVVLSGDGGMLGMLAIPFRLCLGGVLGDGSQWFSWISLTDTLRAIQFVIENSNVEGRQNSQNSII
jgi:NAD dependent epimerase/dehydratase family enzyme